MTFDEPRPVDTAGHRKVSSPPVYLLMALPKEVFVLKVGVDVDRGCDPKR